jgi:hypothetical protein
MRIHAAKIMGSTVASLLTGDGLLAKATDEFNARISKRPYDCPIPDGVLAAPWPGPYGPDRMARAGLPGMKGITVASLAPQDERLLVGRG